LKPTGERTQRRQGATAFANTTHSEQPTGNAEYRLATERRADQRRQGATAFANTTHSDATAMENYRLATERRAVP